MEHPIEIDVCVATRNRPKLLRALLDSLCLQLDNGAPAFNIYVVDNDPHLSAREVCEGFPEDRLSITYLVEPVVNISLARNRAIAAGGGRFIAIIDDDEIAIENWLSAYWEMATSEDYDVLHGPVNFCFPPEAGSTISRCRAFPKAPLLERGESIGYSRATTNCFLLRSALTQADLKFNPNYGCSGSEDSEFFSRLAQNSHLKFGWCPTALTYETVPSERVSLRWVTQRFIRFGMNLCNIEREMKPQRRFLRRGIWRHWLFIANSGKMGISLLKYQKLKSLDYYLGAAFALGYLLNFYFRIRFRRYW